MVKLYMGGSPCTHWSIAQTKNRETTAEGIGWELFKNYLIGLDKFNPDYFLYENNKSMAPAIREQITKELGVKPILINSALVSAQNRQRLYWTNIPGVTQPQDKGVMLADVLESGVVWTEKGYCLTTRCQGAIPEDTLKRSRHTMVAEPLPFGANSVGKAHCLDANYWKGSFPENTLEKHRRTLVAEPCILQTPRGYNCGGAKYDKAPTVTASRWESNNHIVTAWDGKTYPVYEVINGHITIKGKTYPIKLPDGHYIIRKLTVTECKRLQTVPDDYIFPVSNSQAYKMLGNGWTVDVIAHILSHAPRILTEPVEVLSMYDGMSCGRIALNKLGADVARYHATEIDKYAIQTTQHNFPDTIQLGDAFQVRDLGWSIK